jgi:hypothetical protein
MMLNEEILIAVTLQDGSVTIRRFFTRSRGSILPAGAVWEDQAAGIWTREPIHGNVEHEMRRAHSIGSPMVSWRIIKEVDLPTGWDKQDRGYYRNAIVDTGAALVHDMPKAREICRRFIRCYRPFKMAELDGEWMKATALGDAQGAVDAEAQRQVLRDAPADPRIDAAQTIDDLNAVWRTDNVKDA